MTPNALPCIAFAALLLPITSTHADPDGIGGNHSPLADSPSSPALAHPKADGIRGLWFELGQKSEYGDKYSGGLGTYTANHVPMAHYAPEVNRTYFTYGGTPSGTEKLLHVLVSYYDHKTGLVARPVRVMDKSPVNDPHDNAPSPPTARATIATPAVRAMPTRTSMPTGPMATPMLCPNPTSISPTKPATSSGGCPTT